MIKILCLGDVVSPDGLSFLESGGTLRKLREELGADLVIANGENSADVNGISTTSAKRLYDCGVDIITGGNHTWKWQEVYGMLDDAEYMIRPANYPDEAPGIGYILTEAKGYPVLVMNVVGRVFMEPVEAPEKAIEKILSSMKGKYSVSICDVHAEATSEKLFIGRYFDGRLSAVFGTHTHVQTADETVFPGGTGYITDVGMCGSENGIIGVKTENIIQKFTTKIPVRFEKAHGNCYINGILFEIDESSGKCTGVKRIRRNNKQNG